MCDKKSPKDRLYENALSYPCICCNDRTSVNIYCNCPQKIEWQLEMSEISLLLIKELNNN